MDMIWRVDPSSLQASRWTGDRERLGRGSVFLADRLSASVAVDPVPGLYEQLVTEELRRLLDGLEPARFDLKPLHSADAHFAVAEHLRRILERALRAVPEEERLTRQPELCNAVLTWLRDGQAVEAVNADEALVVPLTVLREIRALTRE